MFELNVLHIFKHTQIQSHIHTHTHTHTHTHYTHTHTHTHSQTNKDKLAHGQTDVPSLAKIICVLIRPHSLSSIPFCCTYRGGEEGCYVSHLSIFSCIQPFVLLRFRFFILKTYFEKKRFLNVNEKLRKSFFDHALQHWMIFVLCFSMCTLPTPNKMV